MKPGNARRLAAPGVVLLACLLPLPALWRLPGPPMEEGFMLVFPELVLHGRIPNRDFLHLYGPGGLWVLAAAFKIFGTLLSVERAVGFLQLVGVALGVYAAVKPWGRWLAAAGGVVTAIVVVPPIGLTALAWVGAVALGLWSVVLARSERRGAVVASGLLAGTALLYRPDLVVAVALSGLVVLRGLPTRHQRIRYLGGAAGGVSPYLVHLAMAGPAAVVRGLLIEPVFELRGGRTLPLPPSWGHFDGFLQRAGLLNEPPWGLPAPPSPAQLSLWLALLLAANAALVIAGLALLRREGTADRRLLAVALFSVGLLPQALQRADSTHLAWVSCVPFGLLPAALVAILRNRVVSVLTPFLVMVALVPHFTLRTYVDDVAKSAGARRIESGAMRRGDRVFYYGRGDAVVAVRDLLAAIDGVARTGDTLFVGTGDLRKTPYSEAFLYYLLPDLPPATRYIEMDPGVANGEHSGLADDLAAADVVILSSVRDDWVEPNASREFGPATPNQVLSRDFCRVGSFGTGLFGRGLYELYTRCR
ncbi:MAG TPA: hypothetical protein VM143_00855 [Acidimicrobiales bacterium]|nr:hypothetical protein [Acidimicrobiales bacterium]